MGAVFSNMHNPSTPCINLVCRVFDTETSATISLPIFLKSLAQLKALSASPQSSASCVSYAKYNENKHRHHRVEYDPQSTLNSPVTTQQVSSLTHSCDSQVNLLTLQAAVLPYVCTRLMAAGLNCRLLAGTHIRSLQMTRIPPLP